MAILTLAGVSANDPFCDALDVTFPRDHAVDVEDALRPHLVDAGAELEYPGCWRVPRVCNSVGDFFRAVKEKPSTLRLDTIGAVYRVSFSGGSVGAFRARGAWAPVLANLFPFPHRVTRIDAALDVFQDAPPLVGQVAAGARAKPVRLGQREVPPGHIEDHRALDVRGVMTGTTYIGRPKREIRLKAYDKRHELECAGVDDPGPWFRLELTLRKVGATFRDAVEPGALFWNYIPEILTPPSGAPCWLAGDTGYALPPPGEPDVWKLLQRKVGDWHDLGELGKLADKLGAYGRRMLLGLLARALGIELPSWSEAVS